MRDLTELKQALDGVSAAILKLVSDPPTTQPVAEVKAVVDLDYELLARAVGDAVAAALPEKPVAKKRATKKAKAEPEAAPKETIKEPVQKPEPKIEAVEAPSKKGDTIEDVTDDILDMLSDPIEAKKAEVVTVGEKETKEIEVSQPANKTSETKIELSPKYIKELIHATQLQVNSGEFMQAIHDKFGGVFLADLTAEENIRATYDFIAEYRANAGLVD